MRIYEFGTEHEKTVLLLHSACLSWRMFQPGSGAAADAVSSHHSGAAGA